MKVRLLTHTLLTDHQSHQVVGHIVSELEFVSVKSQEIGK